MTFLIRWAGRLAALFTLALLVGGYGFYQAVLTPLPARRAYDNEVLAAAMPLASANVEGEFQRFWKQFPKVSTFTLDLSEVQINALFLQAIQKANLPIEGSRVFLEPNRFTLALKMIPAHLQKKSPSPQVRETRLPFPLDGLRTRPVTLRLNMDIAFDPKTRQVDLSRPQAWLGRLNLGTGPELVWRTPLGRLMVQSAALSLGLDEAMWQALEKEGATLNLLATLMERGINGYLQNMAGTGTMEMADLSLREKNFTVVLTAGKKVREQLAQLDKLRRDPHYYGSERQKLLSGDLSYKDCELGRKMLQKMKQRPPADLSEEEKEAVSLIEKWVKDPDCGLKNLDKYKNL